MASGHNLNFINGLKIVRAKPENFFSWKLSQKRRNSFCKVSFHIVETVFKFKDSAEPKPMGTGGPECPPGDNLLETLFSCRSFRDLNVYFGGLRGECIKAWISLR